MSPTKSRVLITGATIGDFSSLKVYLFFFIECIDGSMEMSKDEKIRMLEEKLQGMQSQRITKTTGASYG